MYGDSPLHAAHLLSLTDLEWRNGLATWLFSSPLAACVPLAITCASWLLVVATLVVPLRRPRGRTTTHDLQALRRGALTTLACGFTALHGISTGLLGASHRFYLPMYSLVALAAEATLGAAASEVVALVSGFTFASAGLAKLRNSPDMGWLAGRALCRSIAPRAAPLLDRWLSVGDVASFAKDFGWLCAYLAPLAVGFELLAPLLLLGGRQCRIAFASLALAFHFVIGELLIPQYWPQACCYLLLFRPSTLPARRSAHMLLLPPLTLLLAMTAHLRIDTWPLTYVPMYSTDLPAGWGHSVGELHAAAAIVSASRCTSQVAFRVSVRMDEAAEELCPAAALHGQPWAFLPGAGLPKHSARMLALGVADALASDFSAGPWRANRVPQRQPDLDRIGSWVSRSCGASHVTFMVHLENGGAHAAYSWAAIETAPPHNDAPDRCKVLDAAHLGAGLHAQLATAVQPVRVLNFEHQLPPPEIFLEVHGGITLRIRVHAALHSPGREYAHEMTLAALAEAVRTGGGDGQYTFTRIDDVAVDKTMQVPIDLYARMMCSLDGDFCAASRTARAHPYVMYGGNGTGNTFHRHGPALNVLLSGRKEWTIVPGQEAGDRVRAFAKEAARSGLNATGDLSRLVVNISEQFEDSRGWWRCTQLPGEVIYVPDGLTHAVVNAGDEVLALAVQFVRSSPNAVEQAAFEGFNDEVDAVLSNGADPNPTPPARPLRTAIAANNTEAVRLLLRAGAKLDDAGTLDVVGRGARSPSTPPLAPLLLHAALLGNDETVRVLLASGAKMEHALAFARSVLMENGSDAALEWAVDRLAAISDVATRVQ